MSNLGCFIVLEGLDGAGTTTQAKRLVKWLNERGEHAVGTAQPSPGPIGMFIRDVLTGTQTGSDGGPLDPAALAALFVADRADHLKSVVEPALASGTHVICDRYVHSSIAYQGVNNDVKWVAAMNAPMRRPDLTIFVRVTPETAAQRRAERGGQEERFEVQSFQRAVSAGYDESRAIRPTEPWFEIDGHHDIETIHRTICTRVEKLLSENVEL